MNILLIFFSFKIIKVTFYRFYNVIYHHVCSLSLFSSLFHIYFYFPIIIICCGFFLISLPTSLTLNIFISASVISFLVFLPLKVVRMKMMKKLRIWKKNPKKTTNNVPKYQNASVNGLHCNTKAVFYWNRSPPVNNRPASKTKNKNNRSIFDAIEIKIEKKIRFSFFASFFLLLQIFVDFFLNLA